MLPISPAYSIKVGVIVLPLVPCERIATEFSVMLFHPSGHVVGTPDVGNGADGADEDVNVPRGGFH